MLVKNRAGRVAATLLLAVVTACSENVSATIGPSNPETETYASTLGVDMTTMSKKTDGVFYKDLVVGTGAEAIVGRALSVTYSGWLTSGTKFDSNVGSANFVFTLGLGSVISGWDLGLVGMKVGGRRQLVIGSAKAYGAAGRSSIPPNATLVFDVELKAVQ
jgi:FKBP-type peptidyl-prolyl cis-trans isomerase